MNHRIGKCKIKQIFSHFYQYGRPNLSTHQNCDYIFVHKRKILLKMMKWNSILVCYRYQVNRCNIRIRNSSKLELYRVFKSRRQPMWSWKVLNLQYGLKWEPSLVFISYAKYVYLIKTFCEPVYILKLLWQPSSIMEFFCLRSIVKLYYFLNSFDI